ncbi:MAG: BatA and WFA domain-containing protein [Pirellulales bacterium]|nr:BatA and WFA domain-containing protein [Pirellulales bacterium]
MSFLHPWAIWIGALAVAAPVVIHFLTRPRPVRVPLSTLRFVREAVRQQRARHRLRNLLILSLRTLAIAMLALAVAQPRWGDSAAVSEHQSGDALRVVILDVSQSMGATDRGIAAIERARTTASRFLRYRPGLQANLILAGATPKTVFEGPSTNFDALRDELDTCRALPERLDVNRALDAAGKMLAAAGPNDTRRRELVVVSDFQRANWAMADFARLPEDTQIQLESVAPVETPPNVAILRAGVRGRNSLGTAAQLEVEVGNFTNTTRKVTVEVTVGGSAYRLNTTCPPQRKTVLSEPITLRHLGWQPGEAKLTAIDDAMAADDTRCFVVQIRPRPVYALITREPDGRRTSSSFYLQRALAPDGRSEESASAQVVRLDPANLDQARLAPVDLILLDHPGKLSDESIRLLAALLRRGRPIIYVTGESIDATNLKLLADAAGSGLQMPVEFVPPDRGRDRRNLFIQTVSHTRPPFNAFGDKLDSLTSTLRFNGGLDSRKRDGGVADDVLATYSDDSACLVLTSSDAGVLATLNADLAASRGLINGPIVPLLDELIQQMFAFNRSDRTTECGEPLLAYLPNEAGAAAGLRIVPPKSSEAASVETVPTGRLADEGVGVAWHWTKPQPPGVYRVLREKEPVFALALNAPAEESQLDVLEPDVLKGRLAAGRNVAYHGAALDTQRRHDSWAWFAVACVVCVLVELSSLLILRT